MQTQTGNGTVHVVILYSRSPVWCRHPLLVADYLRAAGKQKQSSSVSTSNISVRHLSTRKKAAPSASDQVCPRLSVAKYRQLQLI